MWNQRDGGTDDQYQRRRHRRSQRSVRLDANASDRAPEPVDAPHLLRGSVGIRRRRINVEWALCGENWTPVEGEHWIDADTPGRLDVPIVGARFVRLVVETPDTAADARLEVSYRVTT